MAYFDNRHQSLREAPNCQAFGLRWSPLTQRCENREMLARLRKVAERRGMGFLAPEGYQGGEDDFYDFWFGDQDFWLSGGPGGGGGMDVYFDEDYYYGLMSSGLNESDAWYYAWMPLESVGSFTDTTDVAEPFAQPQQTGGFWDWLGNLNWPLNVPDWLPGPGPASIDPQYGPAGDGALLPGYCPKGQYHPINDPFSCVPFPPSDSAAKKQAAQQQKARQTAMQAAKKAQQQADQQCPKDPQGRRVFRNPQTGKCEVVPLCPTGAKFDSTTRRCLTPGQLNDTYGNNNWLWLLIGGVLVLFVLTRRDDSPSRPAGRRKR